jgi:hypothetical protein
MINQPSPRQHSHPRDFKEEAAVVEEECTRLFFAHQSIDLQHNCFSSDRRLCHSIHPRKWHEGRERDGEIECVCSTLQRVVASDIVACMQHEGKGTNPDLPAPPLCGTRRVRMDDGIWGYRGVGVSHHYLRNANGMGKPRLAGEEKRCQTKKRTRGTKGFGDDSGGLMVSIQRTVIPGVQLSATYSRLAERPGE